MIIVNDAYLQQIQTDIQPDIQPDRHRCVFKYPREICCISIITFRFILIRYRRKKRLQKILIFFFCNIHLLGEFYVTTPKYHPNFNLNIKILQFFSHSREEKKISKINIHQTQVLFFISLKKNKLCVYCENWMHSQKPGTRKKNYIPFLI